LSAIIAIEAAPSSACPAGVRVIVVDVCRSEHILPMFPLQNVVLFPGLRTPLHIFEPRYRQLVKDALAGDGRLVMAVVQPDRLAEIAGDPEVFPIACAGILRERRRLPDGRYHVIVHGTERVRILGELERPGPQLYRRVRVHLLEEHTELETTERVATMRAEVIALIGEMLGAGEPDVSTERLRDIDDAAFVNAACNALPLATPDKQFLLEADGVSERSERLIAVMQFALAERGTGRVPNSGAFQ
jgi:Lon protease-like protein